MKQQVVILNGIIYDYCEETKFYKMLGLLDEETGIFQGIELVSNSLEEFQNIKEKLAKMDSALANITTGFVDEQIGYYTLNMHSGIVCYTRLKPFGSQKFHGNVQIEELFTEKTDSKFKMSSSLEYCNDGELHALVSRVLSSQQTNFIWEKLQASVLEKRNSQKVKVLSA